MLGRICIERTGGWRVAAGRETVMGLTLLNISVPGPGRAGQIRRAARLLVKHQVSRVLVPDGFAGWPILEAYGLGPVETEEFCRSMAAPLALAALARMEGAEERATVVLRGERVTRAMRMAALALCPRVRNVVVSAPLGGEGLQAELRREYGVPNLEERRGRIPDVALHFSEAAGEGRVIFRLYGRSPDLAGLRIDCAAEGLPEDCARLPLLAALWETGKLRNGVQEVFTDRDT